MTRSRYRDNSEDNYQACLWSCSSSSTISIQGEHHLSQKQRPLLKHPHPEPPLSQTNVFCQDHNPAAKELDVIRTCTTMMKLQIANIPLLPKVSRNNWPIGNGNSEFKRSEVDDVAKDAAMKRIQPTISVKRTPTIIAIGAAREAPATSSDM